MALAGMHVSPLPIHHAPLSSIVSIHFKHLPNSLFRPEAKQRRRARVRRKKKPFLLSERIYER
jgi:hypothetical protein